VSGSSLRKGWPRSFRTIRLVSATLLALFKDENAVAGMLPVSSSTA
jgi:hypothetical protein